MPSTILSDNGVSSGSAGLKSTAGNDGVLILQTTTSGGTATNAVTIDTSQNVTVSSGVLRSAASNAYMQMVGASNTAGTTSFDLIQASDSTAYIYNRANQAMIFGTNNTERARIDSSGRFMVGATSSSSAGIKIGNQYGGVDLAGGGGSYANWGGNYGIWPWSGVGLGIGSAVAIGFVVNGGTEAARIDSSGRLLVGTTSTSSGAPVQSNGAGNPALALNRTDAGGIAYFYYNSATFSASPVGNISITSSSTAYNTSSDYRLKENIQPMTGALAKVAALKPCTYKWKADGSDGEGFIAHELQSVVPQCVTGEKDAVDEDGNPQYQGIDTSFLVATLTAAIQELKAEFDAYKATHP